MGEFWGSPLITIGTALFGLYCLYKIVEPLWKPVKPLKVEPIKAAKSEPKMHSVKESRETPPGKAWVRIGGREILVDQEALTDKPASPNLRKKAKVKKRKA